MSSTGHTEGDWAENLTWTCESWRACTGLGFNEPPEALEAINPASEASRWYIFRAKGLARGVACEYLGL